MKASRPALGLLGLALLANTVAAQAINGHVRLLRDSTVVGGALVQLVDSTERILAQTLSDQRGRFVITVRFSGTVRLRGLRIGFRPTTGDPFDIPGAAAGEHSLWLTNQAVVLAPTTVSSTTICGQPGPDAGSAFALWEEARKALNAVLLTRDAAGYDFDVVLREARTPTRHDSLDEVVERDERTNALRPFTAATAERLARNGYVSADSTGKSYAAPDETTLLSETFADTHCLHALPVGATDDTVTLTFTPMRNVDLPDIEGAIILERGSLQLRRIIFQYTNLSAEELRAGAGGQVMFRRLPTGGWTIERWLLHLPIVESRLVQSGAATSSMNNARGATTLASVVTGIQETSGELVRARFEGRELWRAPAVTLLGVLKTDKETPVLNATVTYKPWGITARTGPDGQFALRDVRLGRIALQINVGYLDSIGVPPYVARVNADSATSRHLVIRMPTRDAFIESVCPPSVEGPQDLPSGLLTGTVRDKTGWRLDMADLAVSWTEESHGTTQKRTVRARSNSTGDFRLCEVPAGLPLTLIVKTREIVGTPLSATIPREGRLLRVDLTAAP